MQRGEKVIVVDKSVGPGGRLATRRIEAATFDHGAQFFTVRSDEFDDCVQQWTSEGCPISVWADGLAQSRHIQDGPGRAKVGGDGHPRFVVRGGMNGLAQHLAEGIDVRAPFLATAVTVADAGWVVASGAEGVLHADAVVMTPPVPQSLALLDGVQLSGEVRRRLEHITYDPCLALLVTCDGPAAIPKPGGVQFAEGPVQTLSDNQAKGVSAGSGLTVHLRGDVSRARFDDDDDAIAADVLAWTSDWLGTASATGWQLKRWRYAQPVRLDDDRAVVTEIAGARIAFAGDAFAEPKVEGAARSGLAAARALF